MKNKKLKSLVVATAVLSATTANAIVPAFAVTSDNKNQTRATAETNSIVLPEENEKYKINIIEQTATECTFEVVISETYIAGNEFKVSVNDNVIEANEDETYTCSIKDADAVISVEGVIAKTYNVALPTEAGYAVTILSDSETTETDKSLNASCTSEEEMKFAVNINSGFDGELDVTTDNGILNGPDANGVYSLTALTDNANIVIGAVEQVDYETYKINVVSNHSYAFTTKTSATPSGIAEGETVELFITANEGYSLDEATVMVNGEALPYDEEKGCWLIKNITADVTVEVENIKLATPANVIVPDAATQEAGNYVIQQYEDETLCMDYAYFSITPAENYSLNENGVSDGTNVIAEEGGYYKVYIKDGVEKTLTVNDATYNYKVIAATADEQTAAGYSMAITSPDGWKTNYISVTALEGYSLKRATVTLDGNNITANADGLYEVVLENSDATINVRNIVPEYYNVSVKTIDGIKINANDITKAASYEPYTFTLSSANLYDVSTATVYVNGKSTTPNEKGVYTIDLVTSDISIEVKSANKNSYTIDMPEIEGATVSDLVVYAGETATFDVVLKDGYKFKNFKVLANNRPVAIKAKNATTYTCTIENVLENKTVTIEGVAKKETFGITKNVCTGVIFSTLCKDVVNEGDEFTFSLTAAQGYEMTDVVVKVNGVVLLGNNGLYTIENVTDNQTIEVTGAKLLTHKVTTKCLSGIAFSTTDSYEVVPGGSFTFKISFNSSIDPTTISVKVNGQHITGRSWTYTLNNIQENKHIEITANGVTLNDTNSISGGYTGPVNNNTGSGSDGSSKEESTESVKTGDNKMVYPMLSSMMAVSAAVFGFVMKRRRKENN